MLGATEPDRQNDRLIRWVDTDRRTASAVLFSRNHVKPLALAVLLAVFNNLAGINGVMYYLHTILDSAGVGKLLASWQSVAVGVTNLFFTVLAMRLIDKLGRRTLLLIGSTGLCPIHFGIAAIFWFDIGYSLLLPLTMAYFAVFAFSQASVIWVYLNEIFPSHVRDQGVSTGAFVAWSMGAAITWLFPVLSAISPAAPFLLFGSSMIVQFVLVWLFFPETVGIEIDGVEAS